MACPVRLSEGPFVGTVTMEPDHGVDGSHLGAHATTSVITNRSKRSATDKYSRVGHDNVCHKTLLVRRILGASPTMYLRKAEKGGNQRERRHEAWYFKGTFAPGSQVLLGASPCYSVNSGTADPGLANSW